MVEVPLLIDSAALPNKFFFVGYIDPGTGSILVQFLIAFVVGSAIYFRKFLSKFLSTVRKYFRRPSDEQ
jgi:hypothetical protein